MFNLTINMLNIIIIPRYQRAVGFIYEVFHKTFSKQTIEDLITLMNNMIQDLNSQNVALYNYLNSAVCWLSEKLSQQL